MSTLLHSLKLRILAKTGVTSGLLVWAVIALSFGALALVFFIVTAYVALAGRYGPLASSLMLAAGFLVIAVIAFAACMTLHSRTKERARLALAARQATPWLDPSTLGVVLQTGRRLDPRLLVALLAIPLAAAAGFHWYSQRRLPPPIPAR